MLLLLLLLVSTVLGFEGRRGLHCSRKTMHRQSERQSDNALDPIPSQSIHRNTEGYHARAYQVQEPIGRYSLVAKADKAGTASFLDHSNQGCAVRLGRNRHRYDLCFGCRPIFFAYLPWRFQIRMNLRSLRDECLRLKAELAQYRPSVAAQFII